MTPPTRSVRRKAASSRKTTSPLPGAKVSKRQRKETSQPRATGHHPASNRLRDAVYDAKGENFGNNSPGGLSGHQGCAFQHIFSQDRAQLRTERTGRVAPYRAQYHAEPVVSVHPHEVAWFPPASGVC